MVTGRFEDNPSDTHADKAYAALATIGSRYNMNDAFSAVSVLCKSTSVEAVLEAVLIFVGVKVLYSEAT